MTVVVFAPSWLGDAVMALPALTGLRRQYPAGRLLVAARPGVAPLFDLVPGVDGLIPLTAATTLGARIRAVAADAAAIRAVRADLAVLLPNSARSALIAAKAGVPRRAGYSRDLRRLLLTDPVPRPGARVHQTDAYRQLAAALGAPAVGREPVLDVPARIVDSARARLTEAGWDGRPLVGIAPGATGGSAKRWPSDRVARVVASLAIRRGAACVLVGSAGDAAVAAHVAAEAGRIGGDDVRRRLVDLTGRTTIPELAGVLASCRSFLTNDSGAMHLAAAAGTRLVAVFGPTDDRATSPVARPGVAATVLAGKAWCRPCMFRECPLDHRCMRSVEAERVLHAVSEQL